MSLSKKPLGVEDRVESFDSERKQVEFTGSKEETFFDSQGWLDSDGEDDFVSVNGDFTPNHQINIIRTPQVNKMFSADTFPCATSCEPSSADAKRKLAELLQVNQVELDSEENAPSGGSEINRKPEFCEIDSSLLPTVPHETSCITGNNSSCCNDGTGTPSKDLKYQKEKKMKTYKCCLPSLVCSLRFKERRKQKMSSVH